MKSQKKYSIKECIKQTQAIISKIDNISDEFSDGSRESVFENIAEDIKLRGVMIDSVIESKNGVDPEDITLFRKLDSYLMGLLQQEKRKVLKEASKLNNNHKAIRSYMKQ